MLSGRSIRKPNHRWKFLDSSMPDWTAQLPEQQAAPVYLEDESIQVNITPETFEELDATATAEAQQLGSLHGSIENGDGNYAGIFGELVFQRVLGGRRDNTYEYDIFYNNTRIDVKTKRRTVPPKPGYMCSIASYNTEQQCDIYYFISVLDDYSAVWLLGYLDTPTFYEKAKFCKKGDYEPSNGYVYKADCWDLPHAALKTSEKGQQLPDLISI